MTGSDHIFWLAVVGLLVLAGGLVGGYYFALFRLREREYDVEEAEYTLQQHRLELQRTSYQDSVSKINSTKTPAESADSALQELLERREKEFLILEQESELEYRLLSEENQALRDELSYLKNPPQHDHDVVVSEYLDVSEKAVFEKDLEEERSSEELTLTAEMDQNDSAPEPEALPEEEPLLTQPETEAPPEEEPLLTQPETDAPPEEEPEIAPVSETAFGDFEFHWTPAPESTVETGISEADMDYIRNAMEAPAEPTENRSAPTLPTFQSVAAFVPAPKEPTQEIKTYSNIKEAVGLSSDQFELLSDLGYGTPGKLANMNATETARLAEIFHVPVSDITSRWVPAAKALSEQS